MTGRSTTDEDRDVYRRELGSRIAAVVARFPKKVLAAEAADITVEQLKKWCAGTVKVPACGLFGLAKASGVDLGWLAAGTGNIEARRKRAGPEDVAAVSAVLYGIVRTFCVDHGISRADDTMERTVELWRRTVLEMTGGSPDRDMLLALMPAVSRGLTADLRKHVRNT